MAISCLIESFRDHVRSQGNRVALTFESPQGPTRLSWRTLAALVQAASQHLASHFERDPSIPRRIGHASDNGLADIVIALASMSLGTIEFPFDHRLAKQEIERRWKSIGGLWIDESLRHRLTDLTMTSGNDPWNEPSQPVQLDAPSLVIWTSGTTGDPRGVTLSVQNLFGNAAAKLAAAPQSRDDVRLCVLPLSHAYARTCDFGTWLISGCALSVTLGYEGLQRLAPVAQPTLLNVVPSLAYRMLEDSTLGGLERLRLLGCGGAALSASAFERWQRRGVTVIQGYGLTETSPVICSATPEDAAPGFVGRFVDGWESKIRDQQLLVRGPHVMLGYWNDPIATSHRIDADGWLATGDQVEVNAEHGQVRILGRIDDVIVLESARKIHPASVERAVEHVHGVRHAMLLHRCQLELWFDADPDYDPTQIGTEIRRVLSQIDGLGDCIIHPFQPPLSENRGELTQKGNIRRNRIVQTRFSDQTGS